ncbi:disease resistance protein RGA2 [Coffea arabica]|uniref:Disease resistance protein RGA2 n=1 Tax=Coffea arabica TaxID=13443 RepID=A0ABM4UW93_COFAR|nr:disease resistance protein RGA2-like [Coffea arabica]
MADSFLFDIAHTILGKLGSLALQQFSMVFCVKNDLDKLQKTLLTIKDVLLDAEEQQAKNDELANWVEELKEVLYDADDSLDEIEVNGLRRQLLFRNIKGKVSGFFSSFNPVISRLKMAYKIKDIRARLDSIAADKAKFPLSVKVVNGPDLQRTRDPTCSWIQPSDVIGRNHEKDVMVRHLMQNNSNEENLSVISVVGIGGLGKTTLAKLVYNDEMIIKHFQLRIWLSVSQAFDRSKLAASIVSCATNKPCNESLTFNEVITCLQDSLRGKRFLLILDDVWNEDRPKWLEFRSWLCGGGGGSKVIVTTRNEYVASVMESTYTHKLNSLPDNDCLSLFVKWAFRDGQEKHHPNLVKIGEDIVKKCKGVPLAIRTLGCMLFMKTNERDWLSVRDNEIWLLEQKEDDILPALRLSYNQLPCYLKQCFAYCSMFPKGQDIASIMLIQLWMAQGLIQSCSENEELEDMGTRYVKELCSRSLLEEVEAYGSFITFKMHDLVHDLAVSVAQNERSVPYKNFGNSTEKMRHISLHNYSSIKNKLPVLKLKKIRTLFLPHAGSEKESTVAIGGVISRFKYLRVFDLSHSRLEEVPLSIGDLKHLRYLDLSGNDNIKSLPTTICRLQNLQTLRLVLCTQLLNIPRGIKYLISLRHLYITTRETSFLQKGIGCLTTLQSLSILRCENLTSLFEGAEKLINLRTLVIGDCPRLTSLPGGMKFLTALENLMIINCEELNFSDWQDFQGFTSLRSLMIGGLPRLSDLPQFACTNSNKLEFVRISTCPGIVDLRTWLENASSLRKLEIIGCPKLTSLPDILSCLSGLMVLKIDKCPELSRRCDKELGEDWSKISHVQEICLNVVKL